MSHFAENDITKSYYLKVWWPKVGAGINVERASISNAKQIGSQYVDFARLQLQVCLVQVA